MWGYLEKWSGSTITSIYGSQIKVLGFGDIAWHFIKTIKIIGAKVIGVKRMMMEKPNYMEELYTYD